MISAGTWVLQKRAALQRMRLSSPPSRMATGTPQLLQKPPFHSSSTTESHTHSRGEPRNPWQIWHSAGCRGVLECPVPTADEQRGLCREDWAASSSAPHDVPRFSRKELLSKCYGASKAQDERSDNHNKGSRVAMAKESKPWLPSAHHLVPPQSCSGPAAATYSPAGHSMSRRG